MSERLKSNEQPLESELHLNHAEKKVTVESSPTDHLLQAEAIRKKVADAEQESAKTEDIRKSLEVTQAETSPTEPASRELKKLMLDRNLTKIQRQLPKNERALSKIVHQPTIDKLSDVGAKTIARPLALLSGSLFALVGSIIFLYITKHGNYKYNYLLSVFLFAVGFLVGIIIELLLYFFHRYQKRM